MNETLTVLASPAWWITTAFLALVINLLSAYLKAWLDRRGSARSERAAELRRQRDAKFDAEVIRLKSNPVELRGTTLRMQKLEHHTLANLVLLVWLTLTMNFLLPMTAAVSVLLAVIPAVVFGLLFTAVMALQLIVWRELWRVNDVISAVYEKPIDRLAIRWPDA